MHQFETELPVAQAEVFDRALLRFVKARPDATVNLTLAPGSEGRELRRVAFGTEEQLQAFSASRLTRQP